MTLPYWAAGVLALNVIFCGFIWGRVFEMRYGYQKKQWDKLAALIGKNPV